MEAVAAAMEPRQRCLGWVVAPTYDLADRVFREIVMIVGQSLRHRIVTLKDHERRLVLRNMSGALSEVRGKSADNPVSLLGEGLDWVIVDEAARLKPSIWESHLSQRLLDRKGWALLISTPRGKGWFYDAWRRGQGYDRDYESWNSPSWESPLLDAAQIEAERERLPDRVFRQEYGAEFVEGAGSVFRHVRECAVGGLHAPEAGQLYYAGLDLAKVEDYTVLVIVDRLGRVAHFDRFNRVDWHVQVTRIKAATQRFRSARLLVDTTGVGEPVFESLRRAGCRVMPYPFTMRSKAAIVDNLAMLLERQQIVLPRPEMCPELIDELEGYEFSVTDNGNVRTGAPGGMHDDCVMALALATWELRDRPTPCIRAL